MAGLNEHPDRPGPPASTDAFLARLYQLLAGRHPYKPELEWARELLSDAGRDPVTLLGNLIYQFEGGLERIPVRALAEGAALFSGHFQPQGERLASFLNVIDGAFSALEHHAAVSASARADGGAAVVRVLNPLEYASDEIVLIGIVRKGDPDCSIRIHVNDDPVMDAEPVRPGFSMCSVRLPRALTAQDRVIVQAGEKRLEFKPALDGPISQDALEAAQKRLSASAPPDSVPASAGCCFLSRYMFAAKLPASNPVNADNWPFEDHLAIYRTLRRLSPDLIVEDDYVQALAQLETISGFQAPLLFFLEFWKDRRSGLYDQLKTSERWRRTAALADRILPGGWRWLRLGLDVDCASLTEPAYSLHGLQINRWAAHRLDNAGESHARSLSRSELAERLLAAISDAGAAGARRLIEPGWVDFVLERAGPADAGDLRAVLLAIRDGENIAPAPGPGVAVIGETERSLGDVARSAATALNGFGRKALSRPVAGFIRRTSRLKPETGTILFCANAQRILDMYAAQYTDLTRRNTVAFPFWETTRLPEMHAQALSRVSRVVTATRFVEDTVRASLGDDADVVTIGLPIDLPQGLARAGRSGPTTFLSIADVHSGLARKNPLGSIQAFQKAFPGNRDVRLVLKIRSIDEDHWGAGEDWPLIQNLAARDDRVEIVLGDLPAEEYWAMIAEADCFLSLHRGEGFGYGLAHSLALGIPVVSTDFSGPRDFCTEETGYPVAASLTPVPYEKMDQTESLGDWAEPDPDAAVEQMRAVHGDYGAALARAERGSVLIGSIYSQDRFARQLSEALAF